MIRTFLVIAGVLFVFVLGCERRPESAPSETNTAERWPPGLTPGPGTSTLVPEKPAKPGIPPPPPIEREPEGESREQIPPRLGKTRPSTTSTGRPTATSPATGAPVPRG